MTSWSDKLWSLVVLVLLMGFVRAIYENWPTDGVVSAKDSKLPSKKKTLSFRQAFFDGAVIKISLSAADEDIEADSENPLYFLDQTLDWRSQVRDLLVMSSNQYSVQDKNWHSE